MSTLSNCEVVPHPEPNWVYENHPRRTKHTKIVTNRIEIARHEVILHTNEAQGSRMPLQASTGRFYYKTGLTKLEMLESLFGVMR